MTFGLMRSRIRPYLRYGTSIGIYYHVRPCLGHGIEMRFYIRPYLGYGIDVKFYVRPRLGHGIGILLCI
ncbi:Vang-like protein 2-A [Gossypium arboreum]|uniref:Vang-like protein 2-A n=1 Tax=Gossypium arboreum TaxID=29729 RepID=A0A0B0P1J8_GOSAR|nr:Vang-like protein 2-A [Gossypium arboreum]